MLYILEFIWNVKSFIIWQAILSAIIFLLVKYRFKNPPNILTLKKKTIEQLIRVYEPKPLIEFPVEKIVFPKIEYNLSSYDVFNLAGKFKEDLKDVIKAYGIGTCGPRGFYGTIDIHLQLESKISKAFNKETSILYSNHYAAIQSIIACFCKPYNSIYFDKNCSEAILRGLTTSKAENIAFESLDDLENKLSTDVENKIAVVEMVSKNTGKILDLERLVHLKKKYGFRIILDETFSFPFIYKNISDSAAINTVYDEVDIVMGSLCHGYPTNGAFSCGSLYVTEYQRLSAASYVFSASTPAFIAKAGICCIDSALDYQKLNKKVAVARKALKNVVSDERWPILLVSSKDAYDSQKKLRLEGISVGVNGKNIRICINQEMSDEEILMLADKINKI